MPEQVSFAGCRPCFQGLLLRGWQKLTDRLQAVGDSAKEGLRWRAADRLVQGHRGQGVAAQQALQHTAATGQHGGELCARADAEWRRMSLTNGRVSMI